ncbi:hypothetical protein G6F24_015370 [Rhizopus arrhizus]|nr:hypothetical protein G6F24_015370 [Rhizopus arrhizus]
MAESVALLRKADAAQPAAVPRRRIPVDARRYGAGVPLDRYRPEPGTAARARAFGRPPPAVGAPARSPGGAVAGAEDRTGRPRPVQRWPPGHVCAGRLRPVECADPGQGLPPGRAAVAAGAAGR